MVQTTPEKLAHSIADVGLGYTAEFAGGPTPNPVLGRRLIAHARRIANRIADDDPRLTAFDPFNGPDGYTYFPEEVHTYLEDDTNATWSFERWFTGMSQACAATPPYSAERLAEIESFEAAVKPLQDQGFRIREFTHDADGFTGVIFTKRLQD